MGEWGEMREWWEMREWREMREMREQRRKNYGLLTVDYGLMTNDQ
jgi:hypothetical protein